MTILITLIVIMVLFFFFAFIKDFIYKIAHVKLCAICAAVSLTWIGLLVLKAAGYTVDILLIGILMGQSIVGIMYSLEKIIDNRLLLSLSKLGTVVIGTAFTYFILNVI